jgi:hypothetical protein
LPAAMAMEDIPATVNPAPVTAACEIVTLALPVLVRVKFWELLEPSITLPKLMLVELAASVPDEELLVFALDGPAAVNPTQPVWTRHASNTRGAMARKNQWWRKT